MRLKVVLQSDETLGYISTDGAWTADVQRAIDFRGVIEATDYALSHGLVGVRAVLKCENPQLDLPLPLLPSWGNSMPSRTRDIESKQRELPQHHRLVTQDSRRARQN